MVIIHYFETMHSCGFPTKTKLRPTDSAKRMPAPDSQLNPLFSASFPPIKNTF